jgi:hypothetical protein
MKWLRFLFPLLIALIGNTRAIKKIRWQHGIQSPTLHAQLQARGVDLQAFE